MRAVCAIFAGDNDEAWALGREWREEERKRESTVEERVNRMNRESTNGFNERDEIQFIKSLSKYLPLKIASK